MIKKHCVTLPPMSMSLIMIERMPPADCRGESARAWAQRGLAGAAGREEAALRPCAPTAKPGERRGVPFSAAFQPLPTNLFIRVRVA